MSKTLGIFIATPGRASLWRTLYSIAYQGAPIEDVLVVGDGYKQVTAELVEMAASVLKLPVRYVATEQTRDWGHTQQNYALKHVRGDYLVYQDDDDIFVPRALTEAVRLIEQFESPRPMIGRIHTPHHGLLWQVPSPAQAVLDGHCLVVPNDKRKLGYFTSTYSGDQAYIHTTLRNYSEWAWTDRIWTLARPRWRLWPLWSSEGGSTWCCDLHRDDRGVPAAEKCGTVLFEADGERDIFYASVQGDTLTEDEYIEIAEFMLYAAQSKDIWIKAPADGPLAKALVKTNYKEHIKTGDTIEYVHEWPPFPHTAFFDVLIDTDTGERVPDWRDNVWGRGRRAGDE